MSTKKKSARINTVGRLLKMILGFYPRLLPITIVFIAVNAIISSIPSVFQQNIISILQTSWENGLQWSDVGGQILRLVAILAVLYVISLICGLVYHQLMAVITQGTMKKLRGKMFNHMQDLPIRYFDTHNRGDIMSYYNNDIDAMRQMISESFPQLLTSMITVTTILFIMFYYSLWMALVVIAGAVISIIVTKKIGGKSARYYLGQQKTIGETEGYIEEMINGQKVVKVFNHEERSKQEFDEVNGRLFHDAELANRYSNILMPILNNIGYIIYVVVAVAGGAFITWNVPNVSISGLAMSISVVVPFLGMSRQFAGNINQVSPQINSVVMGLAGAKRIFELLDQEPETDEGYVELVNAKYVDGQLTESAEQTEMWAWKHPHKADGTITYTPLKGDVTLDDVDFSYEPGKTVLHHVSLYAKPGQKIAFVGATGAGKTTITNLLNRFYDIEDGKIRYDGININKIKKSSLRKSLGIVLQDTVLFTGTVMENIRYGRLDATDGECIAAAKLAGADGFIQRLPEGYDTLLKGDGSNLSQGQCQLLAIARAAVADPPVMILDEATSSIDTRTEQIVQQGMDALMNGRTVFVIAHRLSTVKNANAILVLDHGVITERGTHEELLAEKGEYYQLYTGAFELE